MIDVKGGSKVLSVGNYITEEDLSSQADGINLQFTLSNNFYPGTARVFLNGLRQQKGIGKDLVEVAPNKLEFSFAPEVDDIVLVDYIKN